MLHGPIPSKNEFMNDIMEEVRNERLHQSPYQDDIGGDCEEDNQMAQKADASLTEGQKDLICDIFDKKATDFTH